MIPGTLTVTNDRQTHDLVLRVYDVDGFETTIRINSGYWSRAISNLGTDVPAWITRRETRKEAA